MKVEAGVGIAPTIGVRAIEDPCHRSLPSRKDRRLDWWILLGSSLVVVLLANPAMASTSAPTSFRAPYSGATPVVSNVTSTCGAGTVAASSAANLTSGNVTAAVSGGASKSGECANARTQSGFGWAFVSPHTSAPNAASPSKRADTEMVYDAADHYTVLFGGCTVFYCGAVSNDTWKFAGGRWTQLTPAVHPSSRSYSAMVYDVRDRYVLLFGGTNLSAGSFNDTWKFSNGTWTNITPAHSPSPRFGAGIAYDAQDGYVVLFGGNMCWCASSTRLLNDTWRYAAGGWTNITPTRAPSVRQPTQAMTYDAKDRYVVLFGGYIAGGWTLHDTWSFSKGVWTNLTGATHPSSRAAPGFAYDPVDGYVLLYGGYSPPSFDSDTWSFLAGNWTQLSVSGSPGSLSNTVMAFDGRDHYAVLFSGLYSSQTWTYRNATWSLASSGAVVSASWGLSWTAQTKASSICVKWIIIYHRMYCSQWARSTASIVASVNITVTDITANSSHTTSFASSNTFLRIGGGGGSTSPVGGIITAAYATGTMHRNHTYEIEVFLSVLMSVTGASYTVGGTTHNLAASASLQMTTPYGGTLDWVTIST